MTGILRQARRIHGHRRNVETACYPHALHSHGPRCHDIDHVVLAGGRERQDPPVRSQMAQVLRDRRIHMDGNPWSPAVVVKRSVLVRPVRPGVAVEVHFHAALPAVAHVVGEEVADAAEMSEAGVGMSDLGEDGYAGGTTQTTPRAGGSRPMLPSPNRR